MKAAFLRETGDPSVIQFGDLPDPTPSHGQVLVKVAAVSVNPIDTYIRGGANYWPLPQPYIIGCDLAGTIMQLGEGVTEFRVGDRVWGSNQGLMGRQGCSSELAAVDAKWLYPTPSNVTDSQAAAAALVGITAHLGLIQRARLSLGETVFVRGGAGGVGSMVIQIAKALGARVIATAGGAEKAKICKGLGADHVIDYHREDITTSVTNFAPEGVNLFWETLREPDFDLAVSCMAENGRMVLMAGRTARPEFPVGPFYVKGCSLFGFAMFKATELEQRLCAQDLNHWLATGQLKALIDRALPLRDAAEAHRLQESHTIHKQSLLSGKIVLELEG